MSYGKARTRYYERRIELRAKLGDFITDPSRALHIGMLLRQFERAAIDGGGKRGRKQVLNEMAARNAIEQVARPGEST